MSAWKLSMKLVLVAVAFGNLAVYLWFGHESLNMLACVGCFFALLYKVRA